jgi:hypothetical protein
MRTNRHTWPAAIAGWSLLAAALAFADVDSPVRSAIVLVFLLLCPGAAWIRLLPLGDTLAVMTVAVAFSISLDVAVSALLLYAHVWSPTAAFLIVLGIALAGALFQVARAPQPHPTPQEP